jgi:hypothetical protein
MASKYKYGTGINRVRCEKLPAWITFPVKMMTMEDRTGLLGTYNPLRWKIHELRHAEVPLLPELCTGSALHGYIHPWQARLWGSTYRYPRTRIIESADNCVLGIDKFGASHMTVGRIIRLPKYTKEAHLKLVDIVLKYLNKENKALLTTDFRRHLRGHNPLRASIHRIPVSKTLLFWKAVYRAFPHTH